MENLFESVFKQSDGTTKVTIGMFFLVLGISLLMGIIISIIAKYDINNNLELGVEILLLKDQKQFNWSGIKIFWSSLQVPYYKIQEKFGTNEIIAQMYSYYINKTKEEVLSQFFITNSNYDERSRVFTIFNPINIPIDIEELKNSLSFTLKNGFISINYDNEFEENLKGVIYYIILDKSFTRKNVEPVFKELFTSLINANDLVCDSDNKWKGYV